MAAELAASIVAAASTLHEQHTERKILRVIEDPSPEFEWLKFEVLHEQFFQGNNPSVTSRKIKALGRSEHQPRALWLVWHEKNEQWPPPPPPEFEWGQCPDDDANSGPFKEVRVPLAKMLAEGWTIEREIKPAADVSYLVLARTAPRPRPGPPAGGVELAQGPVRARRKVQKKQ